MFDSPETTAVNGSPDHQPGVLIVGAGTMGRGIAEAAILSGCRVTLVDCNANALQDASAWMLRRDGVGSSSLFSTAATVEDAVHQSACHLAIETVAEIPEVKQEVLACLESVLPPDVPVVTNTSSITLQRLAAGCRHPERYCGMHFCHPVRERRLVEVVRGEQTAPHTLELAVAYVRRFGKTPLVVNDAPGFVINRMLVACLNEAMALLLEGISIPDIEAAAVNFGMPSGPFEQIDRMGVDVAVRVGTHQFFAYPDRVVPSALLVKVMKSGRTGAKTGGGFYLWPNADERGAVDPWVLSLIDERRESQTRLSPQALQMRLFLPMLLEGERILDEGLVDSADRIDAALRDGLAFHADDIGLMRWAATSPPGLIDACCRQFEALGARFQRSQWRPAA